MIEKNPLYETKDNQYQAYDIFMTAIEQALTEMHNKVNTLKRAQDQIKATLLLLAKEKDQSELIKKGNALVASLVKWDEEMVQRKSKAYDDVENFPNKFTAEYFFLINQTESSIPRINKSSIDRKAELDLEWESLKSRANILINTAIPEFNKALWQAGVGAINLK